MTKPTVYFSDRNTESTNNMLDKLERICGELGLPDAIGEGDRVMIKTHYGLVGNTNHVRPVFVRTVVDLVKRAGGIPFVADTCGLGYGSERPYGGRTTAPDYLMRAEMNGYASSVVGAPLLLADGYWGVDTYEEKIDGDFVDSVSVAAAAMNCDKIVVLSHAKFHHIGIASALKNMGVGMVGKKSKTAVHAPRGLEILQEKCIGKDCSKCIPVCPTRCITVEDTVSVDMSKCVQCGHCSSICSGKVRAKALKVAWTGDNMAERIVENAMGVINAVGSEKIYYINLALDISDMCDCVCYGAPLLMHDLGIFGSRDPTAIDHATLKKMETAHRNEVAASISKIDGLVQKSQAFFEHALKVRLGAVEYDFIQID
ncbi:MAG: DUF362 domain-containing protein [Candidatus Thorarchaeota archaeon]|nr:MAG: DUF362 domain-containing protein [Candidatus Thorarchaeota archaeon]